MARRSTISKCIADCLGEYFALRTELATAIETPGQAGEPHQGAIIHSLLARSEERVVATLDRRTAEVLGDLQRVQTMLDRLVLTYLAHTPEVPGDLRESRQHLLGSDRLSQAVGGVKGTLAALVAFGDP